MSQLRVQWTPVAVRSLRMIWDQVSDIWDEQMADLFLSSIDETLDRVRQFPRIAALIEGTSFRKYVLHKNVSLFYSIEEERIKVLLVWDNRMDDKDLFEKLSRSAED